MRERDRVIREIVKEGERGKDRKRGGDFNLILNKEILCSVN